MHHSAVCEGHGEKHDNVFGGNKLKKPTSSCVSFVWFGKHRQPSCLTCISPFHERPFHHSPKHAFIMKWINWHILSSSHKVMNSLVNLLLDKFGQKNVPVSQGNLHTILMNSTMATKDRKWGREHQCRQRGKSGQDLRGHPFEDSHSSSYWKSILNKNVTYSFKVKKEIWQS